MRTSFENAHFNTVTLHENSLQAVQCIENDILNMGFGHPKPGFGCPNLGFACPNPGFGCPNPDLDVQIQDLDVQI